MIFYSTALTPREREVLGLIAHGRQFAQVAEDLVISPHTVRTHARTLRLKLGARNCPQAVYLAMVPTTGSKSA